MINLKIFFSSVFLFFISCKSQTDNCKDKLKLAQKMLYSQDIANKIKIDSAFSLLDEASQCDSTKKNAVFLKITLFSATSQFTNGLMYIDSLTEKDFTYKYKKGLYRNNFIALKYRSENETFKKDSVYRAMSDTLEKYIQTHDLKESDPEFEQAFLDLYSVKNNFLSSKEIDREVDSLITLYPNKMSFLKLLKGN